MASSWGGGGVTGAAPAAISSSGEPLSSPRCRPMSILGSPISMAVVDSKSENDGPCSSSPTPMPPHTAARNGCASSHSSPSGGGGWCWCCCCCCWGAAMAAAAGGGRAEWRQRRSSGGGGRVAAGPARLLQGGLQRFGGGPTHALLQCSRIGSAGVLESAGGERRAGERALEQHCCLLGSVDDCQQHGIAGRDATVQPVTCTSWGQQAARPQAACASPECPIAFCHRTHRSQACSLTSATGPARA